MHTCALRSPEQISPGGGEGGVDPPLELGHAVQFEREPQLEGVHFAPALDALVARVVAHVVVLVLLEEVGRPRRVALVEETLREGEGGR